MVDHLGWGSWFGAKNRLQGISGIKIDVFNGTAMLDKGSWHLLQPPNAILHICIPHAGPKRIWAAEYERISSQISPCPAWSCSFLQLNYAKPTTARRMPNLPNAGVKRGWKWHNSRALLGQTVPVETVLRVITSSTSQAQILMPGF